MPPNARLRDHVARFLAPPSDEEAPQPPAPAVPLRAIFRRFWPDARPHRPWLALLLLLAALAPAIDSTIIWLFKLLVDEVLTPRDLRPFARLALAYAGLCALGGLVSFGDDYLSAWVGERFTLGLRTRLFARLHDRSLDFLEGRRLGDVLARLTGDVAAIESLLLTTVVAALANGLRVLCFAGALFLLQWRLALVALLVAPPFWLLARRFAAHLRSAARRQRRASGWISALAEESLANTMLVQAYNRQAAEVERFRRAGAASMAAQLGATRLRALYGPLVDLVELAGVLVVVALGAWQLARGALSLGGLLVFLAYLSQLYAPIRRLGRLATSVPSAAASAERLLELLDQPAALALAPAPTLAPRPAEGALRFERVAFTYPGRRRPAFDDLSFAVAPGELLAVTGASGAGKSTLAKLALRFYDPDAGRITCGGRDLRALDLAAWREGTAALFQDAMLFNDTVRANIAFGRPGATEAAIVRAARAADAHDFILALPRGYDTVVGEKGRGLSGGQRQRLAIARAMLRDASLSLLDEPTAGLDAASARRIVAPLRRLMAGKAVVLITHHLWLAAQADRVLLLDDGRAIECGAHLDLLARGGAYARLYAAQAAEAGASAASPARDGAPAAPPVGDAAR